MTKQNITFVGEGLIATIMDPDTNHVYMQVPLSEFSARENALNLKSPYYCSVVGDSIYVSKYRPCKTPTAFCRIPSKQAQELNTLIRKPLLDKTEVRLRFIEKVCAEILNMAESTLKVAFAMEGKSESEMFEDERVKRVFAQRDKLNEIIKEQDDERSVATKSNY